MMDKLWYLSKISLFETLPEEDLQEIDRMAPMTHFNKLPKGTMVQTPERTREGLFFLKEGKLRLYKLNAEGKQFTAAILGPGNMFGEMDSFSFGTGGLYIETLEETLICSVLKEHFEQFLSKRPQLAMKLLKELSSLLKERDELLLKLALGTIRERVLHLLLKLSDQFGIEEEEMLRIDIALTHLEIANMIGATRESVTLALKELARENVVRTSRQSVKVHVQRAAKLLGLG
ncbi:Crp/Fnr family transcriptional regulator [Paenibacillus sp. YYML68]|uniref:Crp/Fnr family transcriptional regulator n=1 Tax=Paenibacillus sp. YYML68 TaxID=2909250 RepID=UPI002492617C|nr:Crp/Fnr family transcriptional regulator [Paenibacillus sp. YYML68]